MMRDKQMISGRVPTIVKTLSMISRTIETFMSTSSVCPTSSRCALCVEEDLPGAGTSERIEHEVALGVQVLFRNTTGSYNLAVGVEALANNDSGVNNTAVGPYDTLLHNTTGSGNTALGYAALYSSTNSNGNTAVGRMRFTTIPLAHSTLQWADWPEYRATRVRSIRTWASMREPVTSPAATTFTWATRPGFSRQAATTSRSAPSPGARLSRATISSAWETLSLAI